MGRVDRLGSVVAGVLAIPLGYLGAAVEGTVPMAEGCSGRGATLDEVNADYPEYAFDGAKGIAWEAPYGLPSEPTVTVESKDGTPVPGSMRAVQTDGVALWLWEPTETLPVGWQGTMLLEGTSASQASELTDITAVASPAPSLPELEVTYWDWEQVYEMTIRCNSGDSTEVELTLKYVPVRSVYLSPNHDKKGTAFLYRYTEVPGKGHLAAPSAGVTDSIVRFLDYHDEYCVNVDVSDVFTGSSVVGEVCFGPLGEAGTSVCGPGSAVEPSHDWSALAVCVEPPLGLEDRWCSVVDEVDHPACRSLPTGTAGAPSVGATGGDAGTAGMGATLPPNLGGSQASAGASSTGGASSIGATGGDAGTAGTGSTSTPSRGGSQASGGTSSSGAPGRTAGTAGARAVSTPSRGGSQASAGASSSGGTRANGGNPSHGETPNSSSGPVRSKRDSSCSYSSHDSTRPISFAAILLGALSVVFRRRRRKLGRARRRP